MTDQEPFLQRVRCAMCAYPLLQLPRKDVPSSGKKEGEKRFVYRALTDTTFIEVCPRCGGMLSPEQVVAVD